MNGGDTANDRTALRGQAVGEDPLGHVLGQHEQVRLRRGKPIETQAQQLPAAFAYGEVAYFQAACHEIISNTKAVEHLQRVGMYHPGPRGAERFR
jgi:hypothetical protein